ncbi:MAG: hypothetical protein RIR70_1913, partial [Pseudomonadota bacterium]
MKHQRWLPIHFMWILALFAQSALASRDLPDFTELAEKQGAAVVNISSSQINRSGRAFPQIPGLDEDDPMMEFFKRFAPRQSPGTPREQENKSLGSGFIITADG